MKINEKRNVPNNKLINLGGYKDIMVFLIQHFYYLLNVGL